MTKESNTTSNSSEMTWSTCSKPAALNGFLLYSALFSRTIVDTLSILKTFM